MSATHSKACCETAVPATVSNYQAKGAWTDILSEHCYIAGDKAATRAIIWVYDIFGYSHQTLRGADIVAASLSNSPSGPVAVIVPDWFDGTVADRAWVPPVTAEQQQKLGNFIQTKASPDLVVPRVLKFSEALKHQQLVLPNIQKLGIFGFCWGGKLASLACQNSASNIFEVAVQTSPARIDPEEAKNISVPMALLASKDEDMEVVNEFFENLTTDKLLERFDSQIHGWMSGRGDLSDPKVEVEYKRGYEVAVGFFDKYL